MLTNENGRKTKRLSREILGLLLITAVIALFFWGFLYLTANSISETYFTERNLQPSEGQWLTLRAWIRSVSLLSTVILFLVLFLFLLPVILQKKLRFELPDTLEIIILLFIFAAEILGELQCYFVEYPHWDTMLHTLNGFLAAAIGFSMVDILNRTERFTFVLSPLFTAIVGFCFSMTIGVLWEFFEFSMDWFFQFDMQKDTVITAISSVMLDTTNSNIPMQIRDISEVYINGQPLGLSGYLDIGLIDTMKDLFVNFIGALLFSVLGYFYVKYRERATFASRFIPEVVQNNQRSQRKIME